MSNCGTIFSLADFAISLLLCAGSGALASSPLLCCVAAVDGRTARQANRTRQRLEESLCAATSSLLLRARCRVRTKPQLAVGGCANACASGSGSRMTAGAVRHVSGRFSRVEGNARRAAHDAANEPSLLLLNAVAVELFSKPRQLRGGRDTKTGSCAHGLRLCCSPRSAPDAGPYSEVIGIRTL